MTFEGDSESVSSPGEKLWKHQGSCKGWSFKETENVVWFVDPEGKI